MISTARHLREIVEKATPLLKEITDKDASHKENPAKWSKKEIIGHLIDSASNNQQKFVRSMQTPTLQFVKYNQDHWVAAQRYNKSDWQQLTELWHLYNLHLAHIIEFPLLKS